MMHNIKCSKVSPEFTCTYVKHWELSIDELQLRTRNRQNGRTIYDRSNSVLDLTFLANQV